MFRKTYNIKDPLDDGQPFEPFTGRLKKKKRTRYNNVIQSDCKMFVIRYLREIFISQRIDARNNIMLYRVKGVGKMLYFIEFEKKNRLQII